MGKNTNVNIIPQPVRQANLLTKLISDSTKTLPEAERHIDNISIEALIWNLFKSNKNPYQYSAKDVKYIIEEKLKIK